MKCLYISQRDAALFGEDYPFSVSAAANQNKVPDVVANDTLLKHGENPVQFNKKAMGIRKYLSVCQKLTAVCMKTEEKRRVHSR